MLKLIFEFWNLFIVGKNFRSWNYSFPVCIGRQILCSRHPGWCERPFPLLSCHLENPNARLAIPSLEVVQFSWYSTIATNLIFFANEDHPFSTKLVGHGIAKGPVVLLRFGSHQNSSLLQFNAESEKFSIK